MESSKERTRKYKDLSKCNGVTTEVTTNRKRTLYISSCNCLPLMIYQSTLKSPYMFLTYTGKNQDEMK